MKRPIIRVISSGGFGDIILSTPSFKAIKEKHPRGKTIVYCRKKQHREIYQYNPYIDSLRTASLIRNLIPFIRYYLAPQKFHVFNYGINGPSLFYKKRASEIIAEIFDVELRDAKMQIFLTRKEDENAKAVLAQFKKPVILHITGAFTPHKNWQLHNWERLVKEMPEYTFIQLGVPKEEKVEGAIDLRGKTTFREAFALIKNALSFVGVDSSLAHATNAFDIKGVVLFGPTTPALWGHPNNINLYREVRCSPCVDLLEKSDCPYGKYCMTDLTVEEVKAALLRQLGDVAGDNPEDDSNELSNKFQSQKL